MANEEVVDAIVVGAGFAGLYMLKRAIDLGLTIRAFERGADVGGTWYWNRYPGARCDLESVDYSYSFDPELEREWEWSERYAAQPEILRYANFVADRYDLRDRFTFNTTVLSAHFDDDHNQWIVTTDGGEVIRARYCILATGILSIPKPPEIDGLDDFQGEWYHTGQWPHEPVSFAGKRVAVIGTGSSGVQVIPIVAEEASELTVFQRTPNYTVPGVNYAHTPEMLERIREEYPARRKLAYESPFGLPFPLPTATALETEPAVREATWERLWDNGHIVAHRLSYSDLGTSEAANETLATFLRSKIRQIVDDPETASRLEPWFPFGTKRPCLSASYYQTYNRENVRLVDVKATPIVRFTSTGIETESEQFDVDAIIFATGYDAISGAALRIDIRGVDGITLQKKWENGPHAFLGLATSGFPNLFFVMGPGSPTLGNFLGAIEQSVDWITNCLEYLQAHGIERIEATIEAEEAWVDHAQTIANATLYPKTNSWYSGVNVPGKPRYFAPYLGGADKYRDRCDEVAASGYEGFALERAPLMTDAG